jgi:hypothetical protein
MWLSGCRTGGEDVACICPLPCRAGETLSSMHARSTRDMLWLLPCAHAAAQQGAFGDAPRHPASAGRARGEDGGAPRTSTRRGRRPAWRGRRHDFPISCSHAVRAVHSAPILAPQSARRSANRKTMSPPACRTAIACALICQKRLKRDELMRIHQSDTISVGAGTVHEQGVNRSLNSGSGYFLEALDVCPVPTSGTGVYGARGSLNWPHRPEYRLVIQVDGVVRVSRDLARGMVLRAQIVRKCTPLSTNSFAPIRG